MKIHSQTKTSLFVLIVVNLLALFGVIFAGWDAATILLAYWVENIVIGFYTVFKLRRVSKDGKNLNMFVNGKRASNKWTPLFFLGHYGGFMVGHGFFLFMFIIAGIAGFKTDLTLMSVFSKAVLLGLGLFVSHGISYKLNFIGNKEYSTVSLQKVFYSPYRRMAAMHFAIILGAFLYAPVVVLVVVKIAIDIFSHLRERRMFRENETKKKKS